MGKDLNSPSTHSCIAMPKPLATIVQAFAIDSEKAAKTLLKKAANAIYSLDGSFYATREATKDEINTVYALMRSLSPHDAFETLCAAQIIVGHMLGMHKLSLSHGDDQRLGLQLLKFSNDAMERLEKKRNGGRQNIQITYINSETNMQAVVEPRGTLCQ